MSLANPPIDPTIDPVTGLPLDASYFSQYQIPLASQPINLEELNAQGKQSLWMFPDHLPSVVARLQARDLTNANNAQDLSTDGKRNLNVNLEALGPGVSLGGAASPAPENIQWIGQADMSNVSSGTSFMVLSNVTSAKVVKALSGYALHIDANPKTQAADGTWYIYIYAVDIGGNPIGVERPIYRHRSSCFTDVDYPLKTSYHVETEFATPWDVNAMWPNWHEIRLEATIQAFPAYATGWFFYY